MIKSGLKKLLFLAILILIAYCIKKYFFSSPQNINFENSEKVITLKDNGLESNLKTSAKTINGALQERNIKLSEYDTIIPSLDDKVYPGTNIEIQRAVKLKIQVDGKTIEGHALAKNIRNALKENSVELGHLDKTEPELNALGQNNITIVVTRINVEEVVKEEGIDFKTTAKNDSQLGWREKKIETPGEKGVREVKYKITYKNGKEVSRIVLEKKTIKDPVAQVEVQGTYVKVGKAQKGQGTWYAFKGGMYAASLTIPRGGYAKVTNTANGKSVIVQINDSGPYGKGRIIDLDKPAFQKIAPLGAGVIGVKVEEVLN